LIIYRDGFARVRKTLIKLINLINCKETHMKYGQINLTNILQYYKWYDNISLNVCLNKKQNIKLFIILIIWGTILILQLYIFKSQHIYSFYKYKLSSLKPLSNQEANYTFQPFAVFLFRDKYHGFWRSRSAWRVKLR
jgi:hypothetical protein